jgi:hypothetical protein
LGEGVMLWGGFNLEPPIQNMWYKPGNNLSLR